MKHEEIRQMLQDYLDGQLDPESSKAVEKHLADCESCRGELDEIRALLDRAARLPDEIKPPRDLWPGIARAIENGPARASENRFRLPWKGGRRLWPSLVAAAAVFLIVIAVGRQLPLKGRGATLPGGLRIELPEGSDPTAYATIQTLEAQCRQGDAGVQALSGEMPERPEAAGAIIENLRIIDTAINQATTAWNADPKSGHLARMLIAAYQAKVALQGRATEMALTN